IADKVGAHFHADIAHISGLVAAGVHPSPVGIADSVMTTTHKSLCGPRGAMLMTHRKDIGLKIDKAVFPGEQGGGHFNTIAALSLALKLAQTDQFKQLQLRIVQNASRLARRLSEHGLRIVGGKSENHLLLIDVRGSKNHYGVTLDGDSAARLLDVAGIVTNRNTIPGDKSALIPSGVRIGTVWISQLGYGDAEIDKLADAIAMLIVNAIPVEYSGKVRRRTRRAKVPWTVLQEARALVRELTGQTEEASDQQNTAVCIRGKNARPFLNQALASDVLSLMNEKSHASQLIIDENTVLPCTVYRDNLDRFHLHFENGQNAQSAHLFLQDLSDGYVLLANDPYAKLLGPVTVEIGQQVGRGDLDTVNGSSAGKTIAKPYFVGQGCLNGHNKTALPTFSYSPPAPNGLKKTALNAIHQLAGAKMIDFSGYEMPVWYSSVSDEHTAVRTGAALFDVSHMGIFTAAGPTAEAFLDMITTNDVSRLGIGRSLYCYMLDPEGNVIDDLMIYRQGEEFFILVVNAANIEKDWAWLNAVNSGEVLIDLERPWVKQPQPCVLEDARENGSWLLLALQGPKSKEVLIKAGANRDALDQLGWANQAAIQVGNDELIISRTGYTGERIGYEIFATPQNIDTLWQALTNSGATPAGLAARDSVRIEAGLPLYGQELAGPLSIDPDTACFGGFVKLWKPFFVGRAPFIKTFETHKNTIVRFQMDDKGVRRPTQGDPIIDGRGKVIGIVTSCGIDSDGHLTGMALVPLNMRRKGTKLMVYQTNGGQNAVAGPDAITIGSKLPKPDSATVLTRFPSKKRK
ncbi:MAG: glycine cleavage system aminomethyltransferase GcvT, partial [Chloroflexota bacterium]